MIEIPNWLANRAYLTPNRIAIKSKGQEITFIELHQKVLRTAESLAFQGVKKEDIVSVLMTNSLEMIQVIHALKYIGARTVLLNNRLTKHELLWQITDSKSCLILSEDQFLEQLNLNKNEGSKRICTLEELQMSPVKGIGFEYQKEFNLNDIDTIMYTSGTTGKPKGVIQTYGNHWWSAIGSSLNLGLKENDCWLAIVPFFHISGLSILIRSVIYGIPIVLHEKFSADEANRSIMEEGVTIVSVVSKMLTQMVQDLEESRYPTSFRCMLLGGGPAPKSLLEDCKIKEVPVYQTYGMTETASQIVTLSPEYSLSKLGSAGKPLFPSQLRIEKNGEVLEPYEHGEIVVKGPNVTKGYFHRSEETEKAIIDGWLYTGDLGYLDEDGFLYVLDRRSDLIISGGENVYPAEIESILLSHPTINDAGVIGIEDQDWGQVPIAFIVTKEKIAIDEIIDFCRIKLAKYKVPTRIYMVDTLPRNATNKLQRKKLYDYILPEGE
ncbi:o-succinylbenzoate--CoA ligase [Litchfieldia salsa]|uniref:2-succinylbenzoate--CoA ligase n=1 Tax=Litchfieldia salsa TaxID=930152 RepID=A0A1H0QFK8_9BACI|nr:o-succinylbenzoate--CoA ligase [Litchfieldia salsa]SDP16173.1 2-succinylbenzoyl-CoA synthetase [Litchfieldia salsa]